MSKNTKRRASRSTPAQASVVNTSTPSVRPSDRDFKPDYSYVMKDLKRIGTLAGSFFIVLVILSFILK